MRTPLVTSPLNLFQEERRDDAWALLAGCVLHNRARGKVARPVLDELVRRYPTARSMLWRERAEVRSRPAEEELAALFRRLGFQNVRARRILDLARALADRGEAPRDVTTLPGCGRYAAESFEIFHRGVLLPRPADLELRRYVLWAKRHRAEVRRAVFGAVSVMLKAMETTTEVEADDVQPSGRRGKTDGRTKR